MTEEVVVVTNGSSDITTLTDGPGTVARDTSKDFPYTMYFSDRGIPLIHTLNDEVKTLTMENYEKWYSFYIVEGGVVSKVEMVYLDKILDDGYRWTDHTPSPSFFVALALELSARVDMVALDTVCGRWVQEFGLDDQLEGELDKYLGRD